MMKLSIGRFYRQQTHSDDAYNPVSYAQAQNCFRYQRKRICTADVGDVFHRELPLVVPSAEPLILSVFSMIFPGSNSRKD